MDNRVSLVETEIPDLQDHQVQLDLKEMLETQAHQEKMLQMVHQDKKGTKVILELKVHLALLEKMETQEKMGLLGHRDSLDVEDPLDYQALKDLQAPLEYADQKDGPDLQDQKVLLDQKDPQAHEVHLVYPSADWLEEVGKYNVRATKLV